MNNGQKAAARQSRAQEAEGGEETRRGTIVRHVRGASETAASEGHGQMISKDNTRASR